LAKVGDRAHRGWLRRRRNIPDTLSVRATAARHNDDDYIAAIFPLCWLVRIASAATVAIDADTL